MINGKHMDISWIPSPHTFFLIPSLLLSEYRNMLHACICSCFIYKPVFRFISEHMLSQEQPNSTVPKSKEIQNRIIKHSTSCMFFSWLCIKLELAAGGVLERTVRVWHGLVCLCVLVHRLNGVYWCVLLLCCCEEIFKNSLESCTAALLFSLPIGFVLAHAHKHPYTHSHTFTNIHTHTH